MNVYKKFIIINFILADFMLIYYIWDFLAFKERK